MTGATALVNAPYGLGQGPAHFGGFECNGDELSLMQCQSEAPFCLHPEEVGVICPSGKIHIRFVQKLSLTVHIHIANIGRLVKNEPET